MVQLIAFILMLYAISGLFRRNFEFHIGKTEKPIVLQGSSAIITSFIVLIGSLIMLLGSTNGVKIFLGILIIANGYVLGGLINLASQKRNKANKKQK